MNCASLPNAYMEDCLMNKHYIQRILILYFKPNSRSNEEEDKGQFDSNSHFQFISTELWKAEQIQPQHSFLNHSACTKTWTQTAWFCVYTSKPKVSLHT